MMFKFRRIFLALSFLLASSELASGKDYTEIADSGDRIETPAYSILPPREAGWMYLLENPIKIHFGKAGSKIGQSFTGLVSMSRMPAFETEEEFFDALSKQRARDGNDSRFKDLVNDEKSALVDGFLRFSFYKKYQDYGANNLPGGSAYLVIEDYGVSFQHPYNPGVAVTVALSQRAKPEDLRDDFEALAKEFISSIEFRDFIE
jgi:hypothetical protein|tara:strand:+ start:16 stop:627 length:612 start_codon:yes stop_codon:yes gene_type:complete